MVITISLGVAALVGALYVCFWNLSNGTPVVANREKIGWITLAMNAVPLIAFVLYSFRTPGLLELEPWYAAVLMFSQLISLVLLGTVILRSMDYKIRK